jgi:site-specific recombinase
VTTKLFDVLDVEEAEGIAIVTVRDTCEEELEVDVRDDDDEGDEVDSLVKDLDKVLDRTVEVERDGKLAVVRRGDVE